MESIPPVLPPSVDFKDRRIGLIVFGVLVILLGAFFALMLPLSLAGQIMVARQQGGAVNPAGILPALVIFGALAGGLVWLGIGSIQAKRWARALLLLLGWIGLVVGLIALVTVLPTMDAAMEAAARQSGKELPPSAAAAAKAIGLGFAILMYVIVPAALVLFYSGRDVKLTCEQRDPVERWTDRCPLPVLAICLLQIYAGVAMLANWTMSGAMPLAGGVVTGWTARFFWIGCAAFMLFSARGFYRLHYRTWLVFTVVMTLLGLSGLATFANTDLLDYYRATGLSEAQIQQVATSPLAQGKNFLWLCAAGLALYVGYLLYLRHYFVAARYQDPTP